MPASGPGPDRRALLTGWPLAVALGAYVVLATLDWDVPAPGGIDFGPLWAAGTASGLGAWHLGGRRITPLSAIAIGAVVAMVLTDVAYLATQGLRDLHIYLRAGDRFLAGDAVYLQSLVTERPADLANYPFLYPPVTLPAFAALSRLPTLVADVGWTAASVAAAVLTLRLFGVRGWWIGVLLLWPPVLQGIQVGNVAVPLGLLFAFAPRFGGGLVVAAVFKLYSGIAALWLVRAGRWRELIAGVVLVVAACVVALPVTGVGLWTDWLRGLALFRDSQPLLPASLYGFGLLRYVPALLAIALAAGVVVVALRARGRNGLVRLGLASAVVSPSLYAHGLIVGLPAFLALRPIALWTALAITSVAPGIAWWTAIGLVVASWLLPALRREDRPDGGPPDPLDPLRGGVLWPLASIQPSGSASTGR